MIIALMQIGLGYGRRTLNIPSPIPNAEKQETIEILADVQKNVATIAEQCFPGKKIEGGYHSSYWEYESIHEGYHSTNFLSWANYEEGTDFSTPYYSSSLTSFHWTPEYDDYDFSARVDESLEGISLPSLNLTPDENTSNPLPAPAPDSNGNSANQNVPSSPTQTKTFSSDTNKDFTVEKEYRFCITSLDGHYPIMTASNANFTVQLASQNGSQYFYKIRAAGTSGSSSVIYVDGQALVTVTVGGTATPGGVICDTTAPFSIKQGAAYQFQLTAQSRPSFAAGSPSFTVSYAGNFGNRYFFKVHAVGKVGDGCGFYINGAPSPVAVATIS